MKKKIFSSLSIKIGIIIILIELIVLAFTGIYYIQSFGEEVDKRIYNRVRITGNLIAQGFVEYCIMNF